MEANKFLENADQKKSKVAKSRCEDGINLAQDIVKRLSFVNTLTQWYATGVLLYSVRCAANFLLETVFKY
jgi:hypothetical protein